MHQADPSPDAFKCGQIVTARSANASPLARISALLQLSFFQKILFQEQTGPAAQID